MVPSLPKCTQQQLDVEKLMETQRSYKIQPLPGLLSKMMTGFASGKEQSRIEKADKGNFRLIYDFFFIYLQGDCTHII